MDRKCWLILLVLLLSTSINYVDRMALAVVTPQIRTDLGITATQYGAITTVFLVAYMIGQLVAGVGVDRVGVRVGLAVLVVVWSLAAMGHAFVGGIAGLIVLRFVLGLAEAGNWPASAKTIAESIPQGHRAFAMGFFDSGSLLGAIAAPPLVARLALDFGWRAAFVVTGLLGFLWLIAWLAVAPSSSRQPTGAEPPARSCRAMWRQIGRRRELWGLMAARALATPVWWFYVFWLPDYLSKNRGLSLADIGAFGWIPFLTAGAGTVAGGAFSDALLRKGVDAPAGRKCVMVGAALCMTAGIKVAAAATASESLAWASLATFGFGMWSANILALHSDVIPPQAVATAVGLTGMAAGMGGALCSYATGVAVDTLGYAPVFWAAASASIVACLPLLALVTGSSDTRVEGCSC